MTVFRVMMVWLLAVSWLPATLHCAIEQAGLGEYTDACCSDETQKHAADTSHCAMDPCEVLESSLVKQTGDVQKLPPPVSASAINFALLLAPEPRPPSVSPDRADPPLELLRTWQFATRAALQPRAPGLAS